jgi:hypothetical protein
MVQKRNTIREQILAALAEGPLSSKEIATKINSHVEAIKKIRADLMHKGQIEVVGQRLGNKGVGSEKIWALTKVKPKAINAFDWRNWQSEPMFSAREIAYSNSQFLNRTEKRVIVYSRA